MRHDVCQVSALGVPSGKPGGVAKEAQGGPGGSSGGGALPG